jgi:glycosyltransferase involved in cell wall biosynthesis
MPKILFLIAYPEDDASCRYRVHQFIPYLEQAGYGCTIAPFASKKLFHALRSRGRLRTKAIEVLRSSMRRLAILRNIDAYDIVVIHREAFPFLAPAIENLVLRRAKRSKRHTQVVFSFDDAIYAGHDDVSSLSHPWLYRWKHGHGYDEVIRRCDHVIAGNRILAEYACRLNASVTVIPTVVDCAKYQPRLVDRTQARPITIGWMGSPTTAPYLQIVEPALLHIASKHPGKVRFRFVGCPEYRLDLQDFTSVPFHVNTEVETLQQFDIGLMPLTDTPWSRGKCAFKAIQYMASGVATVASPIGVTPDLIHSGVNGFLAASSEDWFRTLDELVRDAALRERIAREGRRTIENEYSFEFWAPRMVALFDQLSGRKGILERDTIAA